MNTTELTEEQEKQFGEAVIKLLSLEPSEEHKDRVDTSVGNKTALGLSRTILRLLEEIKEGKNPL